MTSAYADAFHASKVKREFLERIATSFLDVIIMARFSNKSFSGYEVLVFVQRQLGLPLSPGTVYSKLYSMEREGLIESIAKKGRKKVYRVTDMGKLTVKVATSMDEVKAFFARILEQQ